MISPPIIDLEDSLESINLQVFGESGVGKTVFGASGNTLILSTEGGTISAKRQGSTAKLWKCPTWKDFEKALIWIQNNPDHGFEWITVDSATRLQRLVLLDILETQSGANSKRNPDIPAIQDHQEWQNRFKRFIDALCDLPTNVCLVALSMYTEDREGDEQILPLYDGKNNKISHYVSGLMTANAYLRAEEHGGKLVRRLHFESDPPIFGKDRTGVLAPYKDIGDRAENFNLTKLAQLVNESSGEVKPQPIRRRRRTA